VVGCLGGVDVDGGGGVALSFGIGRVQYGQVRSVGGRSLEWR